MGFLVGFIVFFKLALKNVFLVGSNYINIEDNYGPVAYLEHGRHGTCHGHHFDGGAKIAWKKLKAFYTVS